MIVLIDDERIFNDSHKNSLAKIFRNSRDAISWLESIEDEGTIDELWLDHDLGINEDGETDTIMPFVLKLEEKAYFNEAPEIEKVFIHTMNFTERKRIRQALERFFKMEEVETGRFLKKEDEG